MNESNECNDTNFIKLKKLVLKHDFEIKQLKKELYHLSIVKTGY
jgi:hypothetical protein